MKIESLRIAGIRGIREEIKIALKGKSVLIYGDNGTGKSSLTDSFEWYYEDGIGHLSNEEIGRKGIQVLRNNFIAADESAYVDFEFSESTLNSRKTIDADLSTAQSNSTPDFGAYIEQSRNEIIILRYADLVDFIIASKKQKLDTLQNIIGFGEVANLRDLLKRNAGRIKRVLNAENLDNRKATFQGAIMDSMGSNAYTSDQFVAIARTIVKPLDLKIDIKTLEDVAETLKLIESHDENEINQRLGFLNTSIESLTEFRGNIDPLNAGYKSYFEQVQAIKGDEDKLDGLKLLTLLKNGIAVLKEDVQKEDFCPLCLQEKNKLELISELQIRVEEHEDLENERIKLDLEGNELRELVRANQLLIQRISNDKELNGAENTEISKAVEGLTTRMKAVMAESKKSFMDHDLNAPEIFNFEAAEIDRIISATQKRKQTLEDSKKENRKFAAYRNLLEGYNAFKEFNKASARKEGLENQQRTLTNLFQDFVQRQETALNALLDSFSTDLNSCYTQINPSARIENIKLVPMNDSRNNELVGISIQYDFFAETKQQPTAYLSESHLNCLGISFFLASVKAFNKVNKFFVLDDVISSFDRSHRARFARFIVDKMNDYQIILLTHEKDFFDVVSSEIRGKGWVIQEVSWSQETGAKLEETTGDLKEKVLGKLAKKDINGLGNDIRIYFENVLKGIVYDIGGFAQFRYNNINEKRMPGELLDIIQARISKKSTDLQTNVDIEEMKRRPLFMANILSHDNSFTAAIEDYELMWEDIQKFVNHFRCSKCNKNISDENADKIRKRIRCRCGDENLNYDWK